MIRIFVTLCSEGSNQNLTYNAGDANVVVTLDRSLRANDTYSFFIYHSQLLLMAHAETGPESLNVERCGRSLRASLHARHVWMPGSYFLLLRAGSGAILRFELTLDDHRQWRVGPSRRCSPMSDEDMLSGRLATRLSFWKRLSCRPGMGHLRQWLLRYAMQRQVNAARDGSELEPVGINANLLIALRNDAHCAMLALLTKQVAGFEGDLQSVDCGTLFDPTCNDAYERLHDTFAEGSTTSASIFDTIAAASKRTVYALRNIGALTDTGGKNLLRRILRHCPNSQDATIIMGTQQEIDTLLEQNPSLQHFFPQENRLAEQPFTCEEMILLFCSEMEIAHLDLSPEARDKMCRIVADAYRQGIVSSWTCPDVRHYVESTLVPAYLRAAVARAQQGTTGAPLRQMLADDIDAKPLLDQRGAFDEALRELDAMVGLDDIKGSIATLANRMRFYVERRRLGLPTADTAAYHALFTGNPGTGKTTVARLLGKVYHALGLLSRGEVVCVDRTSMVGRYIGETEENMKQILSEARGNVLFVDEAYTLYQEGDSRDYGRHAVEALLDVLARRNPDMLVIFAGYQKEMDQLLKMNPGLPGRFPYKFRFADYNAQQLMQIAEAVLTREQYELTPQARTLLEKCIADAVAHRSDTFANARWVEQLIHNGIIPAMADRLGATPHVLCRDAYQRIEPADVDAAYDRLNPRTNDLRQRRTIGFCA